MINISERAGISDSSVRRSSRKGRKRQSLSEDALCASVSGAIGDNEPKLFVSEQAQGSRSNQSVPEYFTLPRYDRSTGTVKIVTKWTKDPKECLENLPTLVKLKGKYLYELIPWILQEMDSKDGFEETKQYIDTIYGPVAPPLPIGTFVEMIDIELNNKYNIGIIVEHVEMKDNKDFVWHRKQYTNNVVQILDTDRAHMKEPVGPNGSVKLFASATDVIEIDIFKNLNGNPDTSEWDFEKKYYVLLLHLEKEKNGFLERQLQESDEYAKETVQKQMDILVNSVAGKLRADYHGQAKSVGVGWNANFWFHGLKETLEGRGIEITKRGYVSRANITDDDVAAVFGDDANFEYVVNPDAETMSDGERISLIGKELVWSQYSLKLTFKFIVWRETISLPVSA